MFNPQMTSSQMELLPLVCLCLLSWSGTTSADQHVVVEEGSDVILKCSIDGSNIETAAFEWTKDGQTEVFSFDSGHHHNNGRTGQAEQFKGRVFHFDDELRHGNASIKITNTKVDDGGDYTCEFPSLQPSPTFHVKLFVGAAPKPSVKILDETETSALLQCKAHGVPDLEVHWQDSAGNILPAEKSQVTERGLSYITRNTTVTKTDRFSCVATQKIINHTVSAEIYVSLPVVVEEGIDVILPCSIGFSFESGMFDWKKDGQTEVFLYNNHSHYNNGRTGQDEQFKGRVSHFEDELNTEHGNASIKIKRTKVEDSGDYTCVFPNLQPPQRFNVKLVVGRVLKDRTGENITGAVSEPSVTILHQTQTSALLQCKAHGVPEPELKWQDSAGNILPAEKSQVTKRGLSYITLKTTVTKTDNFSCVATQMKLGHRIPTGIHVYIHEPVLKDRTGENIPGAASEPYVTIRKTQGGVLLQCEVHGFPKPKVEWKDSSGNIVPAEEPQVTETGGSYDIILRAPVTKTDIFHCVVTQEEINHKISAEMYAQTSDNTGLVVGTIFGTLLVVAVVVVLYKCYTKQKHKKDEKQPEEKPKNQQNSEKQAEEIPKNQQNSEKQPEEIPMNQQNSEKQSDQEV